MGGAKAGDYAGEIEAPIEAVRKFGEVARQMLGSNRMVGFLQGVLDVAEHGVDPHEGFAPLAPLRADRY